MEGEVEVFFDLLRLEVVVVVVFVFVVGRWLLVKKGSSRKMYSVTEISPKLPDLGNNLVRRMDKIRVLLVN